MTGLCPGVRFPGDVVAWVPSVPPDALLHAACGCACPWRMACAIILLQRTRLCSDPYKLYIYVFAFCSDGEGRKRTSSTCSNDSLNVGGTPVPPRRISWRQRIFLRVASPMNKSPSAMQQQGLYGAHARITPH